MKCTCPKCHATIEIDLPEVTEAGSSAVCPACSARFTVHKESFGARALHKSGDISCAPCGNQLGSQMHCPSCGTQFPDYLVTSLGRKRIRKQSKKVKLKSSPFTNPSRSTIQLPSLGMELTPEGKHHEDSVTSLSRGFKPQIIAGLVLVALIAGGALFYFKSQSEKNYVRNFVLATYCIQTGTDKSLKSSARISTEWKSRMDAGQPYQPRADIDEDRELSVISGKLDGIMPSLVKTPAKFSQCNEKLAKLQSVYNRLHSLVSSPGNSQQTFAETSSKLDSEYKQAAKEFKAAMPAEIMSEIQSASERYKGLRPLLSI